MRRFSLKSLLLLLPPLLADVHRATAAALSDPANATESGTTDESAISVHRQRNLRGQAIEQPTEEDNIYPPLPRQLVSSIETRVIGGSSVESNSKYPFYAMIDSNGMICGGTLIWPDLLITAAHCNIQLGTPIYMGGAINVHRPSFATTVVEVSGHPMYEPYQGHRYDATILKLKDVVPFDYVLINGDAFQPYTEQDLTIIGHGFTDPEGRNGVSEQLQEASVKYIQDCGTPNHLYHHPMFHFDQRVHFCAGGGGRDTCNGDSGSPLFARGNDNDVVLMGITSWGVGCGREESPGVYTRVSSIYPWIMRQICALSDTWTPDCDNLHLLGDQPTFSPSLNPTDWPTPLPTPYPTEWPTPYPTVYPTPYPTDWPTPYPTVFPTPYPTDWPTSIPTDNPTVHPSSGPSLAPSKQSLHPSQIPTVAPSETPSQFSLSPTLPPSEQPSVAPSRAPTGIPTSRAPTSTPSLSPTTVAPSPVPIEVATSVFEAYRSLTTVAPSLVPAEAATSVFEPYRST